VSGPVLHVDTAATWRGGQNQVLLTALGMARHGRATALACRAGSPLAERAAAAGLTVSALPFRGDLWPPAILALARLLRRQPAAVLLLHDPHAVTAALLASRLAGPRPLVAVRRVDIALRSPFSRRKYEGCARVIVVSRAISAAVQRGGVAASRLRLVYEGVPDRQAQPGGRERLAELGVPDGVPVIGNVAALTDHKDHATLIAAMALVRARLPQARLVVCGDGELRGAVLAQVEALGLRDRVVLAGFRGDLDQLLPAFSVFCLSSRLEGLGTSLLDAMAFGLPVVATAAGGIPEAVEDGVTGRLVPPRRPEALAGALVEVLGEEERRLALGAAGRRRFLERFTAEHMVEATLAVVDELACCGGER